MDITKVLEVLSKYIVELENKIELKNWEIERLKEKLNENSDER